jgi:hypothetical protein
VFSCVVVSPCDSVAYIGTKTGDIVEVDLQRNLFKGIGP